MEEGKKSEVIALHLSPVLDSAMAPLYSEAVSQKGSLKYHLSPSYPSYVLYWTQVDKIQDLGLLINTHE